MKNLALCVFVLFNVGFNNLQGQDTINLKINLETSAKDTSKRSVFRTSYKPSYYHQVSLAKGFSNANQGTTDLFGKKGVGGVAIPTNYVGYQFAEEGDYYFGIITHYVEVKRNFIGKVSKKEDVNYSEYVQSSLPNKLEAGKTYIVSFKVSLADDANFATSGWGVYFSDKQVTSNSNKRLTLSPQLSFNEIVKDKGNWIELKANYQATGNEGFLTIGFFENNFKVEDLNNGRSFGKDKSYYYVSSIKLVGVPMDRDKDGVLDKDDKCPDVFGLAQFEGCPDTDGDGIVDSEDKCPTVFGELSNKGCPIEVVKEEPKVEVINKKAAEIFKKAMSGIQFETGKDIIKKTSYPILDNVVGVLKSNPTWTTTIEGHTDNVGDAEKNKDLSARRALAVKNYIVAKGVSANSLIHEGYGAERPMADNKTPAGRAKNRRVEFKVDYTVD